MTETHDFVIVGSGMNSLVCAALLARAGKQVVVLERNDRIGGCIRTDELFPGYTHDILSSSYPLFTAGPGYEALGADLHAAGLEFANTDLPTAILTDDGRSLIMSTDAAETARRFNAVHDGDGAAFNSTIGSFFEANADLTFGLLGNELYSPSAAKVLFKEVRKRKIGGTLSFFGESLESCRTWVERDFQSELVRGLIAPWVLHAGLGPDDAYSGLMGKVIMGAVGMGGMPIVVGGSHRILDAFRIVIESHGGRFETGADVARVTVSDGAATGVTTEDGTTYQAREAVIANVTPTQLYGRLLESPPADFAARAADYRYGRADMQVHYALDTPPHWPDPDLARVAYVHLTPGLDGVSRAVNEAERGLLPEAGTIVVGQPVALDPTRAPDGGWIFWIQLQELPSRIKGDAAGEITVPADGAWTDSVKDAYLERIEQRLERLIPNFRSSVVGRRAYSPTELEGLNMNLVGGDPYSGACTIDQFLLWRPFPGARNHETPVKQLFHIGASTHPGPGLGGNSGFMVASKFV
ncbi:MAG: NAD(P)/FAD-dependent oxidoreductase [Acidimicrobiia bacterium]|nr:NAD(P)/FAD-dependent oxidoreductase [Acidimicrobiia bacterium]